MRFARFRQTQGNPQQSYAVFDTTDLAEPMATPGPAGAPNLVMHESGLYLISAVVEVGTVGTVPNPSQGDLEVAIETAVTIGVPGPDGSTG